ncbi:feline leukemia virus subgroup C receptor-related protein 2-like isoform X2 [Odontomachus brunneus]|nr:feline leukemia virus subgroup C receptor-related protein 2-like isoform X2 [Odontomachus brunneus]
MAEIGSISNIVARYYGVSPLIAEWVTTICPIFYTILAIPISYLINKYDLRWVLIVSNGLSLLGAFIKIFSVHPNRFYLIIIGKSIVAIAQTVSKLIPGKIATQWFPFHELATASSIANISIHIGIMCSFLFPLIIVKNHESLDDIANDLLYLAWTIAILNTVGFLLVFILFQHEPKLPPSETRALQKISRGKRNDKFIETIKRLFRNRKFILHCNICGVVLGILASAGALFNMTVREYFENAAQIAGILGICVCAFGAIGGITIGIILDKMPKYKELSIIANLSIVLFMMLYLISIILQMKWMLYVSTCVMGFFMIGYTMLGFEISIEYTYPEPENISMGIMDITVQVYTIIFSIIGGILIKMYGIVPVFIGFEIFLLFGLIFNVLLKKEQRRQDAKKMTESEGFIEMINKNNIDGVPKTNTCI